MVISDDAIKTIQNGVIPFPGKRRKYCFFLKKQKKTFFFQNPKKTGGLFSLIKTALSQPCS